jgi:hypothetical protein
MSVKNVCTCDFCGCEIQENDKRGTLVLPSLAPPIAHDDMTGIMMRMFRHYSSETTLQLHICMGCVFGMIRASAVDLKTRRQLLEHITDRGPQILYGEKARGKSPARRGGTRKTDPMIIDDPLDPRD